MRHAMSPIMAQRMTQNMILAPRMIQSMEILQLPIMALQERIQQELQENPVLELQDSTDERSRRRGDELDGADRRAGGRRAIPAQGTGHRRERQQRAGLRPPGSAEQGLGRPLQRGAPPLAQRHRRGGRQEARRHAEHGVAAAVAARLPQRPARLPRHAAEQARADALRHRPHRRQRLPRRARRERRERAARCHRWKSWPRSYDRRR